MLGPTWRRLASPHAGVLFRHRLVVRRRFPRHRCSPRSRPRAWDVISIVSAGTNIVAYLSREKTADTATGDEFDDAGAVGTIDEGRDSAFVPLAVEEAAAADVAHRGRAGCRGAGRRQPVDEPAGWGTDAGEPSTDDPLEPEPVVTRRRRSRAARPPQRRRPSRPSLPVGTPTRPAATNCATGTATPGPSTSRVPASSSPIRPSPDRS